MSNYVNTPRLVNDLASIVETPATLDHGVGSPFSIETEYFNGLTENVTIIDRSGIPVSIPAMNVAYLNHFVIRYKFSYNQGVKIDVQRLSNAKCPTTVALRDAIRLGTVKNRGNRFTATINYSITGEQLDNSGGSIYLTNLDMVISTMQGQYVPRHPFNLDGIRNKLIADEETINTIGSFGYAVQIIDNEGIYGKRYININREVYEITPIKDVTRLSGVYHARTSSVSMQGVVGQPVAVYYTFDEAEGALGFFKSQEEAAILGDLSVERKRELEELAGELRLEELKLKNERIAREREFDILKNAASAERLRDEEERRVREQKWVAEEALITERLVKLKAELAQVEHLRNVESLSRKDHYEERSYGRKDSSETLKWIPGLIAGVAALFLAFR